MKHYTFYPEDVCSSQIDLDVADDDTVHNIVYTDGCDGNLKAIGKLAEGLTVDEVITKLKGIRCGYKSTSCSDQLAINLARALGRKPA